MKKLNKKGFSLVELIIVIAIMAVLIGVLAPQYLKYVEKSRVQKAISNASTVCNAIMTMLVDETANRSELYNYMKEGITNGTNGRYEIDLTDTSNGGAADKEAIALAIKSTSGQELGGTIIFFENAEYEPSFCYLGEDEKYGVDYHVPSDLAHDYILENGDYKAYRID